MFLGENNCPKGQNTAVDGHSYGNTVAVFCATLSLKVSNATMIWMISNLMKNLKNEKEKFEQVRE